MVVIADLGNDSDASFSHAFKRIMGFSSSTRRNRRRTALRHVAVETEGDVREYLAHGFSLLVASPST
jgi:hypothetical protein